MRRGRQQQAVQNARRVHDDVDKEEPASEDLLRAGFSGGPMWGGAALDMSRWPGLSSTTAATGEGRLLVLPLGLLFFGFALAEFPVLLFTLVLWLVVLGLVFFAVLLRR